MPTTLINPLTGLPGTTLVNPLSPYNAIGLGLGAGGGRNDTGVYGQNVNTPMAGPPIGFGVNPMGSDTGVYGQNVNTPMTPETNLRMGSYGQMLQLPMGGPGTTLNPLTVASPGNSTSTGMFQGRSYQNVPLNTLSPEEIAYAKSRGWQVVGGSGHRDLATGAWVNDGGMFISGTDAGYPPVVNMGGPGTTVNPLSVPGLTTGNIDWNSFSQLDPNMQIQLRQAMAAQGLGLGGAPGGTGPTGPLPALRSNGGQMLQLPMGGPGTTLNPLTVPGPTGTEQAMPLPAPGQPGSVAPINIGTASGGLETLSDSALQDLARQYGIDTSWMNSSNITIDPSVRDAVMQAFGSQRDLGNQELMRGAIEAAGGRGLNMTDTPIADPYLRSRALFESQLRGNEASSLLGLSNQRYQQNQQQNQFQTDQARMNQVQRQNFLSGLYNFQQNLAQQAFQNRLQLANQSAQLGLGLSSARTGQNTGSTTTQTAPINTNNALSQIGTGLQGLSSIDFNGLFGGIFG